MEWGRIVLRAAVIVAVVGVVWMHSFAHSDHARGCHTGEPSALSAAAVDQADRPVSTEAPGRSRFAASATARACVAALIGICVALVALAMWTLRGRTMVRRIRMRASPALPRCVVALPAGGRMSFMDLSVLRI